MTKLMDLTDGVVGNRNTVIDDGVKDGLATWARHGHPLGHNPTLNKRCYILASGGHRPTIFPIRTTYSRSKSCRSPSGVTTRAFDGSK
jgi:hypothetical protein